MAVGSASHVTPVRNQGPQGASFVVVDCDNPQETPPRGDCHEERSPRSFIALGIRHRR
jgi:hypothetical protein